MSSDSDAEPTSALHFDFPSQEAQQTGAVLTFALDSQDGWTTKGTLSGGPQGLVISHLEVWPARPDEAVGGSVTSRMLRAIPVGEILASARLLLQTTVWRELAAGAGNQGAADALGRVMSMLSSGAHADVHINESGGFMMLGHPTRSADEILEANAPAKPSPGRAALPDELLREVAEGYLAETGPGKPRGAVKRLAQQLDRPEQTVSRWVSRARKEGWLGPGAPGREGAAPGPRLLEARASDKA